MGVNSIDLTISKSWLAVNSAARGMVITVQAADNNTPTILQEAATPVLQWF